MATQERRSRRHESLRDDSSSLQGQIKRKEAEMESDPALARVRQDIEQAKRELILAVHEAGDAARNLAAAKRKLTEEEAKHHKKHR